MHEQLWRAYQALSPNSIEYLQRIADENLLLNIGNRIYEYLQEQDQSELQARVAIVMLNYIYYKNQVINDKIKARLPANKQKELFILKVTTGEHVEHLVQLIKTWGKPRQRVAATLQQVYSLAIHNKLREARDLMMKTHMASIITTMPVEIQIMYNRALV